MKGLSEIIGSLIVMALTLSAFVMVWPRLSSYMNEEAASSASYAKARADESQELLSPVYVKQGQRVTVIYAYNYGNYPFTAKEAIVGGRLVKANGTVYPGYLSPIYVQGVGSAITVIGEGGVEFTWQSD
jgi:flagellin-like protein